MRNYALCFAMILFTGCGDGRNASEVQVKRAALDSTRISSPWIQIPGTNGDTFDSRPAMVTGYNHAHDRWWYVCGTTWAESILCTYRVVLGMTSNAGMDSGWLGFSEVTPPGSNNNFDHRAPALATWVDGGGNTWIALAARSLESSCYNCVYIQLTENPFGPSPLVSPWYTVPASGNTDSYANVGDISLVASGGYLYLFGINGPVDPYYGAYYDGPPYAAYYAQNYVAGGFSNLSWTWAAVPGGGAFNTAVTATPLDGGGAIVVGIGTDGQAYGQELFQGSWDGYWWLIGSGQTFIDAVGVAAFDPYGADVEVFAQGDDSGEYQGNYYNWSQFDGWYPLDSAAYITTSDQFTTGVFFNSPVAFRPSGTAHIDLVARGGDDALYTKEFNGSPNP